MNVGRGWYLNSLKDWKKDFEREQRQGRKRLESLRGMGHPCAADQEELLSIREGWIKQIDMEIAAAISAPASFRRIYDKMQRGKVSGHDRQERTRL